jgi:hypothetical protein
MAYTLKQFDTGQEMMDYMNGVVRGKPLGMKVYGLHGLTLIVTPVGDARTVTFDDPGNQGLTPLEIVAQIEDENADLVGVVALRSYRHTTPPSYHLAFTEAGDIVDKDGTANAILGFSDAADSTVGDSAVALADIGTVTSNEAGNKFTVIHQ